MGRFTPVIGRSYPLGEVPEAMRYMAQGGGGGGKIVITSLRHGLTTFISWNPEDLIVSREVSKSNGHRVIDLATRTAGLSCRR